MARNWSDEKNLLNKRNHKVSFEVAFLVFDDLFAVTREDYIDESGEMRYQTLGLVEGALIFVAHVYRIIDTAEEPWLISARKAVKNEETIYFRRR